MALESEPICRQLLVEAPEAEPSANSTSQGQCTVADVHLRVDELTNRETEVFGLLHTVEGNEAIAVNLNITERTVRAHMAKIHDKFQTRSRLELTLLSFVCHHGDDVIEHAERLSAATIDESA